MTKIEWTDYTANFWWGCTKVSSGCANCYAESLDKRTGGTNWGPRGSRRFIKSTRDNCLKWNRKAAGAWRRPRVFCQSMSDLFEDYKGPVVDSTGRVLKVCHKCGQYGADGPRCPHCDQTAPATDVKLWMIRNQSVWPTIRECTNLDWLLLTKRPENILRMMPDDLQGAPHIWLGTSVEDQQTADERIPHLLQCPAAVRFLSCEPLLGPVDLKPYIPMPPGHDPRGDHWCADCARWKGAVDWVIVGGESGPGARPMHPDWVRSIRDQCQAAGVPFFMKQMSKRAPIPEDLMIREFPSAASETPLFVSAGGGHGGPPAGDVEGG